MKNIKHVALAAVTALTITLGVGLVSGASASSTPTSPPACVAVP